MASSSKKNTLSGSSERIDRVAIYAKPGLFLPISTNRIMEAMGGPYSEWMIQEGPIDFRVRWRASLWPSSIKKSELDAFRERYKIPNTIEMFVPALDGKLVILERQ